MEVAGKVKDLRRLEAQRNELNAKGKVDFEICSKSMSRNYATF